MYGIARFKQLLVRKLPKKTADVPKSSLPIGSPGAVGGHDRFWILIIGATGRIGSRVIVEIAKVDSVQAVYSSRTLEQVNAPRDKGRLWAAERSDGP
jgi:hypothetical protein